MKIYLFAWQDKFVRHKHIKNIMQICAEIGVSDVIFVTFEVSNK